jgi:hypothetical protein
VAKLNGICIADRTSSYSGGAAFLLSRPSRVSEVVQFNQWETEVAKDSPYVVGRVVGATDAQSAFENGYEVAQQGLDWLCASGYVDLSIRDADDEHILWWRDRNEQILRLAFTSRSVLRLSGKVEVRDKDGNLVPPTPQPTPLYHECLRYFRLSQVTDDLFDAFRNMYLTFEMILDHRTPRRQENESKWLRRALRQMEHEGIEISRYFPLMKNDAINSFVREVYEDVRCAMFHAKGSHRPLHPLNRADREQVSVAFEGLSHLVIHLLETEFHIRKRTGTRLGAGFGVRSFWESRNLRVLASSSDVPVDDGVTIESGAYEEAVSFPASVVTAESSAHDVIIRGTVTTNDLTSIPKLTRVDLADSDDVIAIYQDSLMDMTLDGVDRIEVQFRHRIDGHGQPRNLFHR